MQEFHIRLPDGLGQALRALAVQRKEPVAVVVRNLLSKALAEEAAADGKDVIKDAVRQAMRDVLKPTEERLAKLAAKAAIAAATSMYLNTQAIADLGKNNAVELYRLARSKAAAYLREKDEEP